MRLLALRAETMQAMRRLKLPCDDITPIGLWGSDMFLIGVNNDQFEVLRLWNVQTEDVTPATLRDLHTESTAIPTSPSAGNAASGARSSARGAPSAAPASSSSSTLSEESSPAEPAQDAPEPSPAPVRASGKPGRSSPDAGGAAASSGGGRPVLDAPSVADATLDLQPAFAAVAQPPAPEAPAVVPSAGAPTAPRAKNGAAGTPSPTGDAPRAPELKLEPSAGSTTSRSSRTEEARPSKGRDAEAKPKEAPKDGASNAGKLRMTVDGEHLYAEIKGGKIVLKDRTYDSLAHARDSIRRERNKVAVWEYFDEGVKAWRVLNRD